MCQILIIDDDVDLCAILHSTLGKICIVHIKHDLTSAISYLTLIHPVIILLDNSLPDGFGIEHLPVFITGCPTAKVIVMTADIAEDLEKRALKNGAHKFIRKPFSLSAMKELIYDISPELRIA